MSKFTERLSNIPERWRTLIVDVVDTADTIRIGIEDTGNPDLSKDPNFVAKLTELVVSEKWSRDDLDTWGDS
jgi:hypothetical protein